MAGRIGFWLNNARPQALPQSVMPAVVAMCMAIGAEGFCWWLSLLAIVGVAFAHLSVNLLDDYFDYRNAGIESRERLARAGMRARIGKANYLAEGQATLGQTFAVAALLGALAVVCGGVVFLFRGWMIVAFAAMAGFLGFFYSAKPLKLSYRGLGEVVTGIIFGPLLMMGVYYSACGAISNSVWFVSTAMGLLVINILYTHSIMDYEPDRSVGKHTLATLLGCPAWMLAFSAVFNFFPFVVLMTGVLCGELSAWFLLAFVALPMAIGLFRMMVAFFKEPERKYVPKPWMGPMPQWKEIEEAGVAWFMIRWFLSRNIVTLYSIVIAAVAVFVL